jgi:hypothetical protein
MKVDLPAKPFADWLDRRVVLLGGEYGGVDALVEELGLNREHGSRAVYRFRNCLISSSRKGKKGEFPTATFPFEMVERALERSPFEVWDVYPWLADVDLGDEAEVRYAVQTSCPVCGGRKSAQAATCVGCVARNERGHVSREGWDGWENVCPKCGGDKTPGAKLCWPCYKAAGGHRGRKHRKANQLMKVTPEVLAEAYGRYEDGLSVRAVAAEVFDRTEYATMRSCANGLRDAWANRGWPLRDRAAATAQANRERVEGMPQCRHISQASGRKGQRCPRRTMKESGLCWHHEPERIAEGLARIRAAEDPPEHLSTDLHKQST